MLRKLLAGPKIEIKGFGEDCERGYKFRGELAIGNLISGAATNTSDWRGPNGTRSSLQNSGARFNCALMMPRTLINHRVDPVPLSRFVST